MARKRYEDSMTHEVEQILRQRAATAGELAEQVYREDTPYTRRLIVEMVSRLRNRHHVDVRREIRYRVGGK